MHALGFIERKRSGDMKSIRGVLRVGLEGGGGSIHIYRDRSLSGRAPQGKVFVVVGEGDGALGECVAGCPVEGEVDALAVREMLGSGLGVEREPGFGVGADGFALVGVGLGLLEVLRVGGTVDVEAVAVVSGDEDERVVEDAEGFEAGDGGADGVVELEEVAERAVVVEGVHLLVDGSSLTHEEETLVTAALVENVDGFEGHLLEAGEVSRRGTVAGGRVLELGEVFWEYVPIDPDGEVGGAEKTESLLVGGEGGEGGVCRGIRIAFVLERLDIVLLLVRALSRQEILGASAKHDIGTGEGRPGVVCDAVEHLVDEGAVERAGAGVCSEGNWGGICNEGGGDGTNGGAPDAGEQLDDGLDLGVVKGIGGGVCIDAHGIDGGLVARVEGRGRVGRVGHVCVDRVRLCPLASSISSRDTATNHLMPHHRERIHRHLAHILSIDTLMPNQPRRRNHIRRHPISNKQNHILCFLSLAQLPNSPIRLRLGPIVVRECSNILAGLVEGDAAVGFGGNVDNRGSFGVLGEEVFTVFEGPFLELGGGGVEEGGDGDGLAALLLDRQREFLVRNTAIRCGSFVSSAKVESVLFRDVPSEPLTGACTSTLISKYCPGKKSAWSGGKTHPKSGQEPSRWKVCALASESTAARTTAAYGDQTKLTMVLRVVCLGYEDLEMSLVVASSAVYIELQAQVCIPIHQGGSARALRVHCNVPTGCCSSTRPSGSRNHVFSSPHANTTFSSRSHRLGEPSSLLPTRTLALATTFLESLMQILSPPHALP